MYFLVEQVQLRSWSVVMNMRGFDHWSVFAILQVKANPELQKYYTQIQEKVNQTMADLRASQPDVAASADSMGEKVTIFFLSAESGNRI